MTRETSYGNSALPSVCLIVACIGHGAAFAQPWAPPEGLPESSMVEFAWHSTHNSFEAQDEYGLVPCTSNDVVPLATQLDAFGVSFLELDVKWFVDSNIEGDIQDLFLWTQHLCADECGWGLFLNDLIEIRNSISYDERFLLVQLDTSPISDIGDGCTIGIPTEFDLLYSFETFAGGTPEAQIDTLNAAILSVFPREHIYTPEDMLPVANCNGASDYDQVDFPSLQEMMRNGKRIMFITNNPFPPGCYAMDDVVFLKSDIYPVNTKGTADGVSSGELPDPTTESGYRENRFSRSFPGTSSCGVAENFRQALDLGYNFPTTNCLDAVDGIQITNSKLHPVTPVRVNVDSPIPGFPSQQLGTYGLPYYGASGFQSAVFRLNLHSAFKGDSVVEVLIQSGTYDAPRDLFVPEPPVLPINAPMVIRATGGNVVIR